MNKADLIDSISSSSGLPKSKVDEVLGATIDCIIKAVSKGENVQLVGFGTFLVSKRKATTGRNPQTGASINIPAANVPKFRPGKSLKESLN